MLGQNVEHDESEQGEEDKVGRLERYDVPLRRHGFVFFFFFPFFFFLGDCSEIRQTSTLLREEGKSFFYRSIRVLSLANNSINGGDF